MEARERARRPSPKGCGGAGRRRDYPGFDLVISPTARRQLTNRLPEPVAFAAHELIVSPLLDNPPGVGKRLQPPLHDRHSARRGTYRVIHRINDDNRQVTVVAVIHRAGAYR